MNIFQAAVLGIVQGLTEFLPVSSSGHLVFAQHLLGFDGPLLAFDVVLHVGTLLAVFVYFREDVGNMIRQCFLFLFHLPGSKNAGILLREYPYTVISGWVILATLPTALIGFIFHDAFEVMFGSLSGVGIGWLVFGIVLILSRKIQNGSRTLSQMNLWDALLIGTLQGVAIIPSISRSGATIIAGMLAGIQKNEAARFSFLLSIPAIFGAALLELKGGIGLAQTSGAVVASGLIASAVVGYLSIAFLLRLIQRGNFFLFGFYCLIAGAVTLIYSTAFHKF